MKLVRICLEIYRVKKSNVSLLLTTLLILKQKIPTRLLMKKSWFTRTNLLRLEPPLSQSWKGASSFHQENRRCSCHLLVPSRLSLRISTLKTTQSINAYVAQLTAAKKSATFNFNTAVSKAMLIATTIKLFHDQILFR